jgi:hypothetical protein
LLLRVNFEDKEWHGITIKRGSRVSSLEVLAEETNLTVRKVRTAINHLEKTGELTRRKYPDFTVFTLVNFNKFQEVTGESTKQKQIRSSSSAGKRQQYNKDNKENKDNNSSSASQCDMDEMDMYNPNYDFGYIPEGKDF